MNEPEVHRETVDTMSTETGTIGGYRYRLYHSADAVASADWDEVCANAGGDPMMTLRLLRVVEAERIFGSQQRYLLLDDAATSQPAAAAIFTILPVDAAAISGAAVRNIVAAVRRVLPHFLQFTVALCGTPLSLGQRHLAIRPGTDAARVIAALDQLLRRLARQAGTALVAYKEFAPRDLSTFDELLRQGYQRVPTLPIHLFPTHFSDFEDYLAALKYTYRNSIRRSQKKLRQAGASIERIEDPACIAAWHAEEVHRLYLAVAQRAKYQFEVLSSTFFRSLAQALPGEFGVLVARSPSGQTVGFLTSLRAGGRFQGLYMGLDYDWNARCDLYFNLVYAELDYALRQGAREIDMGQTADTFKSRLGSQREPRYLYVRVRGGIRPRMLRWALPLLFPPPEAAPAFHIFAR